MNTSGRRCHRTISRSGLTFTSCLIAATLAGPTVAGTVTFLGPTPYLCIEDSPFDISGLGVNFFLEDFEDGLINSPGLTIQNGGIAGPGGITDSVDCDDGMIDGSGVNGRSCFGIGSTGITATFNSVVLGGFPTAAGMVWTDGGAFNTVTFEAFDTRGVSLGTIVAPNLGDGSFNSGTAEDRFFGVVHEGGISKIFMKLVPSGGGSGIEIDHVQYGFVGLGSSCIAQPDINNDGFVDGADLGLLLASWLSADCATDLNDDGTTDGADLGLLLSAWTG